MHLSRLFPVLLLTAAASAQSLIYDNGPMINHNGLAMLQTSTAANPPAPSANFHSVFGYGVNNAALVTVADDFAVPAGGTLVQEVELFYYQTGSTTTPTATGVFLEILNAAPSLGGTPVAGSPGFANNLFTTNLVSHTFTGIYKVQDVGQAATNRPIMSVKVSLPTPVVLTTGVYWLQWSLTGSLASGPWAPPLASLNQPVTGNAQQKVGAAGVWAGIVSGTPTTYAQGLPFKLYGAAGTPGSITLAAAGCGSTGISVQGAPVPGGYLRTTLSGVVGLGLIGYSFNTTPTPYCGCTFSHGWDVVLVQNVAELPFPQDASFCGLPLGVQGVDFGAAGGCPIGFTVTDGYNVTLSN